MKALSHTLLATRKDFVSTFEREDIDTIYNLPGNSPFSSLNARHTSRKNCDVDM